LLFDLVLRVQQKVLLKMQQSCPLKGKTAPQANMCSNAAIDYPASSFKGIDCIF
jgi:hypothetical protein